MATSNPFAPFASTKPMGAPQLRPMPVPNSNFQKQPSLMTKLAPTAFGLAMGSDEAGQAKDYLMGQGKDAWSALTAPAVTGIATNAGTNAALASNAAALGGGISEAALASQALATGKVAAGTGATLAAAGPMAALGPMGVPLLIGATLMSGK